ncbi:hypothetical protein AB0K64_23570 [Streptomyces sp. NPDC053741]|nr:MULTISPECIES: hypothetical protein [Streptomyces]MBD2833568.1 hypothetical protein [Streptomyces pratensis]MYT51141.1 hypothetical protein [Streptomyces sp. SID7815]MYT57430.1 hypothetical protein [Streptomyces sp. SID7834]TPN00382.1 hypothetical protein FKO01_50930 [Mesorhizobium sp. B2-3-3]MCX4411760.1 hypothetical protein [[Kitasatospora] papulosa]
MSMARRTLLTTTAAGTLLCALWFVPSANATGGTETRSGSTGSSAASSTVSSGEVRQASVTGELSTGDRLADTGAGVDTTPYLIGGTLSLCVGAGFVAYSVRRGGTLSTGL